MVIYSIIPLDIDDNRNFTLQPKDEIILYSKDITENLFPLFKFQVLSIMVVLLGLIQ